MLIWSLSLSNSLLSLIALLLSSPTLPILPFPPSPIDDDDSVVAVCCDHHPIDEKIPSCSHGNDGSSIILHTTPE